MADFKITKEVYRKPKKYSKLLGRVMIVLAVVFVLLGIIFSNGYMLPAIGLAALYYYFNFASQREYEYNLENGVFTVDVIKGKRRRKTEQYIYLKDLEVIAPPDHEMVAKYKKDTGTEKIPKFDYTSYQDGVPYYTMITMRNQEKIKLLLDLDDELLFHLKKLYPQKVYRT